MPALKDILKKDINRTIDGVIKADDESRILQEVDEYVLTDEISRQLDRIVDSYLVSAENYERGKQPHPLNGVWISGYFGSGKSHLLKILAYLLDEKQGKNLKEFFIPKIRDQFLKANFDKMSRIPATSILFNIDQMADAAKTREENAVLFIFEKAFNRMHGFFHENRYIAEFERHLAEEGKYEDFKKRYQEINRESWDKGRAKAFGLGRKKLISALSDFEDMSNEDARGLIEHYRKESSITVESFAKRVKGFLDSQKQKNHRINFFIDEVGQFIANNTRLMLNLQTIAETLATVCEGRAWIFVTSQEDLNKVIGDPTASQTNDFSKIHARFKMRVSLSSAAVQEVIEKRLLEKTESGGEDLGQVYTREKDNLRTIFSFRHGGKDIYFKGKSAFVASYPFQAYQYHLLQQALQGLSVHNAFMGRHVSRGERSMLEIFQDVSKSLQEDPLYRWATFDQMFAGIRNTLKTELLSAINTAERHLDIPMAIRLLKILLMVKYVKDFTATEEHLKILVVPDLNTDLKGLSKNVQEALNILEHQTYIERNGTVFQYLTDEEKDIEEEIKNTSVEVEEIRRFYSDVIFNGIVKSSKIRYSKIDEDYPYKRAVDDEQVKGNADLTIRVITPLHPQYDDTRAILNQSSGKKELIIYLEPDSRFDQDIRLYFKTDVYTRQMLGQGESPQIERILSEKQHQNVERRRQLEGTLQVLTGQAVMYVLDQEVDAGTAAAADRIIKGFETLIAKAYPHLRMLKTRYTEESLRKILFPDDKDRLLSDGGTPKQEDEQELYNFIMRKDANLDRPTLSTVLQSFTGGQYGWYPMAVLCVLAKLYVRNAIEIREGGDLKDRGEVHSILSKNRNLDQYVIKLPPPEPGDEQIRRFKSFHQDFLHKTVSTTLWKEMALEFKKGLLEETNKLEGLLRQKSEFPFLEKLEAVIHTYRSLLEKELDYYLHNIDSYQDEMLQHKEETADPISVFMEGGQKSVWLSVKEYVYLHSDNFSELECTETIRELKECLSNPEPYKGGVVQTAKKLMEEVKSREETHLKEVKESVGKMSETLVHAVIQMAEFREMDPAEGKAIVEAFRSDLHQRIERSRTFSNIRDSVHTYGNRKLDEVRLKVLEGINPKVKYATSEEKRFDFEKQELTTEADVKDYAAALEAHYLELIKEDKRIGV
ncbi:MAG: BREX system P-loop protein BrxC [Planctomycetes bacterium]|nr:BREX system P-loop protein BrxC [Planctomycetota bacterium]